MAGHFVALYRNLLVGASYFSGAMVFGTYEDKTCRTWPDTPFDVHQRHTTVREIVRMQEITRMPGSADVIEGVLNLHGKICPVVERASM